VKLINQLNLTETFFQTNTRILTDVEHFCTLEIYREVYNKQTLFRRKTTHLRTLTMRWGSEEK
jgi:hypothetical protein